MAALLPRHMPASPAPDEAEAWPPSPRSEPRTTYRRRRTELVSWRSKSLNRLWCSYLFPSLARSRGLLCRVAPLYPRCRACGCEYWKIRQRKATALAANRRIDASRVPAQESQSNSNAADFGIAHSAGRERPSKVNEHLKCRFPTGCDSASWQTMASGSPLMQKCYDRRYNPGCFNFFLDSGKNRGKTSNCWGTSCVSRQAARAATVHGAWTDEVGAVPLISRTCRELSSRGWVSFVRCCPG